MGCASASAATRAPKAKSPPKRCNHRLKPWPCSGPCNPHRIHGSTAISSPSSPTGFASWSWQTCAPTPTFCWPPSSPTSWRWAACCSPCRSMTAWFPPSRCPRCGYCLAALCSPWCLPGSCAVRACTSRTFWASAPTCASPTVSLAMRCAFATAPAPRQPEPSSLRSVSWSLCAKCSPPPRSQPSQTFPSFCCSA